MRVGEFGTGRSRRVPQEARPGASVQLLPVMSDEQVEALKLAVGTMTAHGSDETLPPPVRAWYVRSAEVIALMVDRDAQRRPL